VICGTRYGNVMASRGSVIPLFIEQIKKRMPLTVTDPKMTRFMMSIEDAVDLVIYAFEKGKPGDIYVQKAPAATIDTIANALKRIFKSDNPVQIIGTRHGEKLFETLLTREEMARAEDLGKYYRIPADTRDLNYNLYFIEGQERVSKEQDYNSHNTRRLDLNELVEMLSSLDIVRDELKGWKK
jgi:UDP-N-acetylglucosamine 4,6-dehydratase